MNNNCLNLLSLEVCPVFFLLNCQSSMILANFRFCLWLWPYADIHILSCYPVMEITEAEPKYGSHTKPGNRKDYPLETSGFQVGSQTHYSTL